MLRLAILLLALLLVVCGIVLMLLRQARPATRAVWQDRVRSLWRWCWKHGQELVGLPVALLVFYGSGIVLRWLEPTSAIYDAGVLQGITVVAVHLIVGNSMARIGSRINAGWFFKGQTITQGDRQWLYAIYLAAYCLLAAVL